MRIIFFLLRLEIPTGKHFYCVLAKQTREKQIKKLKQTNETNFIMYCEYHLRKMSVGNPHSNRYLFWYFSSFYKEVGHNNKIDNLFIWNECLKFWKLNNVNQSWILKTEDVNQTPCVCRSFLKKKHNKTKKNKNKTKEIRNGDTKSSMAPIIQLLITNSTNRISCCVHLMIYLCKKRVPLLPKNLFRQSIDLN